MQRNQARRARVARSVAKRRQRADMEAPEDPVPEDPEMARAVDAAEACIAHADGGISAAAIKAIAALPHGPARTFEVKRWARRAHDEIGELVTLIYEAMTNEEIRAVLELNHAYREISNTPRSQPRPGARPRVFQ